MSSTRAVAVLLLALTSLAGCSLAQLRTRARLGRGDLEAALDEAGRDRYALQEVAVAVLIKGLESPRTRLRAAQALRQSAELIRPELRRVARGARQPILRALAAEALSGAGDRRSRRRLRRWLESDERDLRVVAIRALAGDAREPELFEAPLGDADAEVRAAAIEGLREQGEEPWAVELLEWSARRDPEWVNRAAALRTLSMIEQGEALIDVAVALLDDEQSPATLRLAAITALGRADDLQRVEPLLLARLDRGGASERLRAASILASYGHPRGHAHLLAALVDPRVSVARDAAVAVGRVDGPLRDALLVALRRPEPEVRLAVARSLLRLGEREVATVALEGLLAEPGWDGLQAALALARGGDPTSAASLRLAAALEDESPEVRAYAAFSCGFTGGRESVDLAASALADEDELVRVSAAAALLGALRRERRSLRTGTSVQALAERR